MLRGVVPQHLLSQPWESPLTGPRNRSETGREAMSSGDDQLALAAHHALPSPLLGADAAAFTRAVAPHLPRLYRLCLVLARDVPDAEDLLQEAQIKAWRHRGAFDGSGSLAGWLHQIVRRTHFERVRQRARRRSIWQAVEQSMASLWDVFAAPQSPEALSAEVESADALLEALRTLPLPYAEAVTLCDLEGMDYATAAAHLGVPVGTVKSRHARGRERLRNALAVPAQGDSKEVRRD